MAVVSNTTTVSISSTSAPAWFSALPERTWTDIAGGTGYSGAAWQKGTTLKGVEPSPAVVGGNGHDSIIKAWNGAVALQSRREYLKIAEGGHTDYFGNEIYALSLGDETPQWKRIWGPTPNAQISTSAYSTNAPFITNLDGTPRTMHGWYNRAATDGPDGDRLWIFLSDQNGLSTTTTDVWSIARSGLDTGVYNPSLWMYHGRWLPEWTGSSEVPNQSGPTCWDKLGNQIFVAPEADVRSTGTGILGRFINVSTCVAAGFQSSAGNIVPGTTTYLATAGNPLSGMATAWSCVATNSSPRCLIARKNSQISVWNLESPSVWRDKTVTGGTLPGGGETNAYYNATNRKIVLGGAGSTTLTTISIPTDPWNASTGFNYGTIAPAGGNISYIMGGASLTNSMFQVINDMGNGQACAVMHVRATTAPTYVYKLPEIF